MNAMMITLGNQKIEPPDWLMNRKKTGSLAWRLYQVRARLITTIFKYVWFEEYDTTQFQLDHKYSILDGFKHQVPLNIISNPNNLQFIPKRSNLMKGASSSISRQELYQTYQPDQQVDGWVAILTTTHDEDRLAFYGWFADLYFKGVRIWKKLLKLTGCIDAGGGYGLPVIKLVLCQKP